MDEEDGFTFVAVDDSIPRVQDVDGAFPDARWRTPSQMPGRGGCRWPPCGCRSGSSSWKSRGATTPTPSGSRVEKRRRASARSGLSNEVSRAAEAPPPEAPPPRTKGRRGGARRPKLLHPEARRPTPLHGLPRRGATAGHHHEAAVGRWRRRGRWDGARGRGGRRRGREVAAVREVRRRGRRRRCGRWDDTEGETSGRGARPSLAPLERPIWAFPRSHQNRTDWASTSLASRPYREPNRSKLHYVSLAKG